jgi:hypothetical protein
VKLFNSKARQSIAAMALAVAALPAEAGLTTIGQVDIRFNSPIFFDASTSGADYDNVKLHSSIPGVGGGANAGLFQGIAENATGGFDPNVLYRGPDDVLLYCVDLFQRINAGAAPTYEVLALDDASPNILAAGDGHNVARNFDRTLDFLGALNVVLETSFGLGEGVYNWLNPTSGWMSGAIQVGIWESLYESDQQGLNVGSGSFSVTKLSSQGSALLGTVFDAVNGAPNAFAYDALAPNQVLVLASSDYQDMIVGDPPSPAPAPAPLFLIAGGLAFLARRREQARS